MDSEAATPGRAREADPTAHVMGAEPVQNDLANGAHTVAADVLIGRVEDGPQLVAAPTETAGERASAAAAGELDLEPLFPTVPPATAAAPGATERGRLLKRIPVFPEVHIDDRLARVVLSAVLAILLWFYVVNLENPTVSTQFRGLSLEVRGTSTSLKMMNTLPAVDAQVKAPQNVLGTLSQSNVLPFIDLSGLPEGVHRVPVRSDFIGVRPGDIDIKYSPAQVEVQLDVQVTRVFSVAVQTQGTPAFGYGLEPAQVTPEQVRVTGPRDSIARITRVVASADVDGKALTQQGLKTPAAFDSGGLEVKGLSFDPQSVQVVVPIRLLLNYRVVPVRVPVLGQPSSGYRVSSITVDPTNVTVCCSPSLLESLQFVSTDSIPITGTTSTVLTTTQLILPRGLELYPGQPAEITVTVAVEAIETTLQVSVAPAVLDLPPGFSAVVSPNKMELTLAGTFAQLQSLSPADVKAIVSAQSLGAGTYTLTPQVSVPQGVKLELAQPNQVTVTLIAPTPVPTGTPHPTPTQSPQPSPSPSGTPAVTRPSVAPSETLVVSGTAGLPPATPLPTPRTVSPTATP